MKKQILLLLTALSFYTRCPVPAFVHRNNAHLLPAAIRYLPVVGWITGLIAGLVYIGVAYLFGVPVALILSTSATILFTGAFHEDGFADVCDGFGGGYTKERILEIMKDSRLGTYGVVGLVLAAGLKFAALQELLSTPAKPFSALDIILFFIVAHTLSRFAAMTLVFNYNYARIAESKVSGAVEKGGLENLILAAVFTAIPLLFLLLHSGQAGFALVLLPVLLVAFLSGRYFQKRIGGYTGDCLGAVQQLSEVIIYLGFILVWKFI